MEKCLQYAQAAAMVFALGVLIQGGAVYAEAPPDSDGDGLSDVVDQCPQEPGPERFQGCDPCDDLESMVITEAFPWLHRRLRVLYGLNRP